MPKGPDPRGEKSLQEGREQLEQLDRRLLALLRTRCELVERLWQRKLREGLPLDDPAQERRVVARAVRAALEEGLEAEEIERIFAGVLALGKGWARPRMVPPGLTAALGSPSVRAGPGLSPTRGRRGRTSLESAPWVKCA